MTRRHLHGRLDRVARALEKKRATDQVDKNRSREFTIDPLLAEAVVKDSERLWSLTSRFRKQLTAEESDEKRTLKERVADLAVKVVLPVPYGRDEMYRDQNRLGELWRKTGMRGLQPSDSEGLEIGELKARKIAYAYQTDEGRAWRRIEELENTNRRTIAVIDEILRLHEAYPPLPEDPGEPACTTLRRMRELCFESLKDEKRSLEKYSKKYPNREW
jgi:hypothetical protein